ncbi:MAG: hypothetical protein GY737_19800 [Desulfobacteraceae bacterium]|nr:hypothetical protein [Desulfobacteraceae bacterium]
MTNNSPNKPGKKQIRRPYIIDVEASGFGQGSYPIEIGLALELGERYCSLLTPAPEWTHWDETAEKIHCVPRKSLLINGSPIAQVANDLNRLLKDKTIYSDGWVVDKPWLTTLFYAARIHQRFSISPIELILSEDQMAIWDDTKARVTRELALKRHRASADALIIQETYVRTRAKTC